MVLFPISFRVGIVLLVVLLALTKGEKAGTILGEVICDPCVECLLEADFDELELVELFKACKAGEAEDEVVVETFPLPCELF